MAEFEQIIQRRGPKAGKSSDKLSDEWYSRGMAKISVRLDDQLLDAAKEASGGNLSTFVARAIRHELVREELAAMRSDVRIADAQSAAAAEHEAAVDAHLAELGR